MDSGIGVLTLTIGVERQTKNYHCCKRNWHAPRKEIDMKYTEIKLTIGYSNNLTIEEVKQHIRESLDIAPFLLLDVTDQEIEFTTLESSGN